MTCAAGSAAGSASRRDRRERWTTRVVRGKPSPRQGPADPDSEWPHGMPPGVAGGSAQDVARACAFINRVWSALVGGQQECGIAGVDQDAVEDVLVEAGGVRVGHQFGARAVTPCYDVQTMSIGRRRARQHIHDVLNQRHDSGEIALVVRGLRSLVKEGAADLEGETPSRGSIEARDEEELVQCCACTGRISAADTQTSRNDFPPFGRPPLRGLMLRRACPPPFPLPFGR